eukprot:scaffold39717_cov42-Cyclotella_meneghiniana.AAC.2
MIVSYHVRHSGCKAGKSTDIGICLSIGRVGGTGYVELDCFWHSIGVTDCCWVLGVILTYLVMMMFDASLEGH